MSILIEIYKAKELYKKDNGAYPTAIRVCSDSFYQIKKELYPNSPFDVKTIQLLNFDRMVIVGGKHGFSGFELLAKLKDK